MDTPLILQCIIIISCTLELTSNFKRKMLGENDEGILKIKMDVLEQEERVLVLSFNALNIFRFCIYINAYLSIYLLILLNWFANNVRICHPYPNACHKRRLKYAVR